MTLDVGARSGVFSIGVTTLVPANTLRGRNWELLKPRSQELSVPAIRWPAGWNCQVCWPPVETPIASPPAFQRPVLVSAANEIDGRSAVPGPAADTVPAG